jgi:Tol biopolymer transport system component
VTTQLAGLDRVPSYSPDGTKIAFARNTGGNWGIWTINSTGGANANRITDSPASDLFPTWSPDGKTIAFSSNRAPASSFQIYSVASTGREVDLSPITTQLAGFDMNPSYSPDGNKIAFQRTVNGAGTNANIWTISSTGGTNANQITDDLAEDQEPTWQSLPKATQPPPGNPPGNNSAHDHQLQARSQLENPKP